MKKVIMLFVFIFVVCLSSCRTFFGYYYSLEEARGEKENYYENSDYIYTICLDTAIVDFIIKEDTLNIVEIEKRKAEYNPEYQIKTSSLFSLEEQIYIFKELQSYNWTYSTKFSLANYSWCIVSSDFNYNNDNVPSFEFQYDGELYCLCYQVQN